MARTTISQRIALTGGEAIEKQLKALGESGEKAFAAIQAAAEKLKGPGAEFARSMDRAQKKIRELGEEMKRVGEQVRNWGAGLSAGVTAPVGMLGQSFIQAASDAEEARSAFDFLFAENAEKVRDWSRTVAREMNRGSQTIQDQAMSFQQLFSQVTESDAAVKLSQDFAMLAQDLASFYNVAESDALAKLRSGLSGEAEPMRDFGVFLNAAAVEAKALELGLEAVNGEFTDQQKVVARAAVIMEQTAAAQGDAARTAGSYANQLKGLQGQWHDLRIAFGELILPAALKVVQALGHLVETILSLPKSTQMAIVVIGGLAAALGPILMVVGQVVMGLGFLSTGLASLMASGGVLMPVLAKLASAFGGVATAMRGVMMLVAPMLGWPALLAAAIGAMAVVIYRNWDEISAAVAAAAQAIMAAAGAAWDWIADSAAAAWTSIAAFTAEKLNAIRTAISDAAEWIVSTWEGAADAAEAFFQWILREVLDLEGAWIDSFARILRYLTVDWVGGIRAAFDQVVSWAKSLGQMIRDFFSDAKSGAAAVSGGAPGYAGGGRVRGPGSATSDSILARLSNGEFVVRARAVQHYGSQLFDLLNGMALPRGLMPGFAAGGLVPASIPALAEGGAASGGGSYATVNLTLGGEVFGGLMAPRETAERLIRFAMTEDMKSAGRRPGWYRDS